MKVIYNDILDVLSELNFPATPVDKPTLYSQCDILSLHVEACAKALGVGIRGIAWWKGKVYTGTVDGRLIALDAKTGQPVWVVQTLKRGNGQFITGAPRRDANRGTD